MSNDFPHLFIFFVYFANKFAKNKFNYSLMQRIKTNSNIRDAINISQ